MALNEYQLKTMRDGIRHWYETWPARWAAMTPEQQAAHTAERAKINAEVEAHRKWLDWCAKSNTHPKGAL